VQMNAQFANFLTKNWGFNLLKEYGQTYHVKKEI
jgi:hypothetical protein